MVKARYLQFTHDSTPGDVKAMGDHYVEMLVLLGKVEYLTGTRIDDKKNKRKAGNG